jgi:hypothetical protein
MQKSLSLIILFLAIPLRAEEPVGSAYLRTLTPQAPSFGRLVSDQYPYDGVRIQRWRRDNRPCDWLLVWIDLKTPGLTYRVSPIHQRPGPGGEILPSADPQTTRDFLRSGSNPKTDLAINTVAYYPHPCTPSMMVFLSEPVWRGEDTERNPTPGSLMFGLTNGEAFIDEPDAMRKRRPQYAFGNFFGREEPKWGVLVRRGQIIREGGEVYPRTAVGVSQSNRVVIILVADGYNPGVSEGLTPGETAQILHAAGAFDAIMLDGGGSSTLVAREGIDEAVVLNRPAGLQNRPGTERYVAVNLGFAGLNRTPDEPLPALPNSEASWLVRNWEEVKLRYNVHPLTYGGLTLAILIAIGWLIRMRYRRRK